MSGNEPPEGFRPWLAQRHLEQPYDFDIIECWREGRPIFEVTPWSLPSYFNVAGLYWRPIKRHMAADAKADRKARK